MGQSVEPQPLAQPRRLIGGVHYRDFLQASTLGVGGRPPHAAQRTPSSQATKKIFQGRTDYPARPTGKPGMLSAVLPLVPYVLCAGWPSSLVAGRSTGMPWAFSFVRSVARVMPSRRDAWERFP